MKYRKEYDGGNICRHYCDREMYEHQMRSAYAVGMLNEDQLDEALDQDGFGILVRGVWNLYKVEE